MRQQERSQAPSLTIVGGQPSAMRGGGHSDFLSRGIEQVLQRAVEDEDFYRGLFVDRLRTLAGAHIDLGEIEQRTLNSISDAALGAMIAALRR